MLFTQNLIRLVRIHLKYLHFLGRYPISLDSFSSKLSFSNQFDLKREYLKHAFLLVISVIMTYQIFVYQDDFAVVIFYEGILYVCAFLFVITMVQVCFVRSDKLVELFNLIVAFERNLIQGKVYHQIITVNFFGMNFSKNIQIIALGSMQLLHKPKKDYIALVKLFQFCGAISPPVVFTCHIARFWFRPCKPYVPGFDFLAQCSKHVDIYYISSIFNLEGKVSSIYWTGFCLILYYLVLKPAGGCFLVLFQLYFVMSSCIRYYLKNILENIKKSTSGSRNRRYIQMYKQIQLLVCYYNQIYQDIFTTTLLVFVGLCIVIGLYALITSFEFVTPLQFLVLGAAASQAIFGMLICFGNFGGIYDDSLNILAGFRSRSNFSDFGGGGLKEFRLQKKFVNSLQPVKIKLGSVNYVNRMMPITFIDFCFDILVNMLLIK